MSNVPNHLKYTKEHEWVEEIGENRFRIGITDYAQSALGDIVFIQIPKVGEELRSGAVCGEVESTKSVSEIYAPLSGKVVAVNSALESAPEVINADPYGKGWIFEIEIATKVESGELLSAPEYQALTA